MFDFHSFLIDFFKMSIFTTNKHRFPYEKFQISDFEFEKI